MKFIAERKNKLVKLRYGKVSNTGNNIYKFKQLKKHNFRFKKKIKVLKNKVSGWGGYYDKGDDNEKSEDAGEILKINQ